jgi:hypothetical protein
VDGGYTYQGTEETDVPPQHVVFQFQNLVVSSHAWNATNNNFGGWKDADLRKFVTPVDEVNGSGSFLAGLTKAGVPESVLWAPTRTVSTGHAGGSVAIKDRLWVPTLREMTGGSANSNETVENQARLEYYQDNQSRIKYTTANSMAYTLASTHFEANVVDTIAAGGGGSTGDASYPRGLAPAFCIK